jgi:hypothetical protein
VQEQHEQYFKARGDLRPARTIFFEQLIAKLVIWKLTDSDIILLGDFNENVYSGRIAKCLSLSDLLFTEQCLHCTRLHIPPTFRDGTVPIDAVLPLPVLNALMRISFLIEEELAITDASSLISHLPQLLGPSSPI